MCRPGAVDKRERKRTASAAHGRGRTSERVAFRTFQPGNVRSLRIVGDTFALKTVAPSS